MVVQLTNLLGDSTAALLAYAVPLLLLSILISFSGTFLTLDRSRTFAPHSDFTSSIPGAFEKRIGLRRRILRLDGGVGGIAIGYVFGLHASTFLSLLIMNETSVNPMSSVAFLLTWLFSVFPMAIVGGRWKIAAVIFIGLTGGVSLSIAIGIVTHPSLTSRVIIAAIFTPLVTLFVVTSSFLPSALRSNLAHSTSRLATSCSGAFSATMAIALLTKLTDVSSWANAWDRLWIANGEGWGTSKERGFDALFCVLWIAGALSDWALKRRIGEDPEERWDTYLAEYTSTLPNAHDRAGRFVPLQSWWTRLLRKCHILSSSPASPREIIFPTDVDYSTKADYSSILKTSPYGSPASHLSREGLQRSISSDAYNWEPSTTTNGAGMLRKAKTRSGAGLKRSPTEDILQAEPGKAVFDITRGTVHLKKARSARTLKYLEGDPKKRRGPVEFRPKDEFAYESDTEDSSDGDDELKKPFFVSQKDGRARSSPLVRVDSNATNLSGTTIHPSSNSGHSSTSDHAAGELNVESEKARLAGIKSKFGENTVATSPRRDVPDYSDVEEDVTAAYDKTGRQPQRDLPGWKPEFLKHALSSSGSSGAIANDHLSEKKISSTPPGAVPSTPSLVYALGRIAKAQADAYGLRSNADDSANSPAPHPGPLFSRRDHISIAMNTQKPMTGLPIIKDQRHADSSNNTKWDTFWDEIRVKAGPP